MSANLKGISRKGGMESGGGSTPGRGVSRGLIRWRTDQSKRRRGRNAAIYIEGEHLPFAGISFHHELSSFGIGIDVQFLAGYFLLGRGGPAGSPEAIWLRTSGWAYSWFSVSFVAPKVKEGGAGSKPAPVLSAPRDALQAANARSASVGHL
jgi:hypothetical protein